MRRFPVVLALLIACNKGVPDVVAPKATVRAPAAPSHPFASLPSTLDTPIVGESFNTLFAAQQVPPKDQFETTAAYQSRIGKMGDSTWHMLRPEIACGHYAPSYDADKRVVSVVINLTGVDEDYGPMETGQCIREYGRQEDTYDGSNAFGARVKVTQTIDSFDVVTVPGDAWIKSLAITLSRSPDSARAEMADVQTVLFFQILKPGSHAVTGRKDWTTKPTVSDPTKLVYSYRFIEAAHLRVAAINTRSGVILGWKTLR